MASRGSAISLSLSSRYSEWAAEALDGLPFSFLITDPFLQDHPIVFASRAFLSLSGYPLHEVLGRNGRSFQGPATNRRSVLLIREAVRKEAELQLSILNYRKDGSPHWILFHMFPVFAADDDGRVVHFVGVQVPIVKRGKSWNSRCLPLNTCRNEMLAEADLRCDLAVCSLDEADDGRGLEAERSREAGECEKQKAVSAAKDILSMLVHYSKVIGRPVCRKRSSLVVAGVAQISSSLATSLGRIKQSFVLTDPHLPDMPIVYCSDDFLSLTGYTRQEVLGCNCRFLNGPDTDVEVLHQVRDSIRAEQSCTVRLLNYRKDGSSFWNLLHVSPVRNASGKSPLWESCLLTAISGSHVFNLSSSSYKTMEAILTRGSQNDIVEKNGHYSGLKDIAFLVGVQTEESFKNVGHGLRPEMRQLGVVASVKVAVRSPSAGAGSSRSS